MLGSGPAGCAAAPAAPDAPRDRPTRPRCSGETVAVAALAPRRRGSSSVSVAVSLGAMTCSADAVVQPALEPLAVGDPEPEGDGLRRAPTVSACRAAWPKKSSVVWVGVGRQRRAGAVEELDAGIAERASSSRSRCCAAQTRARRGRWRPAGRGTRAPGRRRRTPCRWQATRAAAPPVALVAAVPALEADRRGGAGDGRRGTVPSRSSPRPTRLAPARSRWRAGACRRSRQPPQAAMARAASRATTCGRDPHGERFAAAAANPLMWPPRPADYPVRDAATPPAPSTPAAPSQHRLGADRLRRRAAMCSSAATASAGPRTALVRDGGGVRWHRCLRCDCWVALPGRRPARAAAIRPARRDRAPAARQGPARPDRAAADRRRPGAALPRPRSARHRRAALRRQPQPARRLLPGADRASRAGWPAGRCRRPATSGSSTSSTGCSPCARGRCTEVGVALLAYACSRASRRSGCGRQALGGVPDLRRHDRPAAARGLRAHPRRHRPEGDRLSHQPRRGRLPAAAQAAVRAAGRRGRRRGRARARTSGWEAIERATPPARRRRRPSERERRWRPGARPPSSAELRRVGERAAPRPFRRAPAIRCAPSTRGRWSSPPATRSCGRRCSGSSTSSRPAARSTTSPAT